MEFLIHKMYSIGWRQRIGRSMPIRYRIATLALAVVSQDGDACAIFNGPCLSPIHFHPHISIHSKPDTYTHTHTDAHRHRTGKSHTMSLNVRLIQFECVSCAIIMVHAVVVIAVLLHPYHCRRDFSLSLALSLSCSSKSFAIRVNELRKDVMR